MSLLLLFSTLTPKKLVAEGDSLTAAGASWPAVYSAARSGAGYTVTNVATGGHGLSNVLASIDTQIYANTPEVVGIFLQANDLSGPDDGATVAENILSQFVDPVRARGIKVVGFTSTPQATPSGNPTIHNPRRAAFDSAMRAAYSGGRLEGLVDIAADPILGVVATASDTFWYGDGLHLTGAGYARLGTYAIPAIDEAFGYASDTVPAAFTIAKTHANASTLSYSSYVKPTGFDTPTPISVTGGAEIEINDTGYWTTSDLLPINGYFRLRRTSASSASTLTSTVDVGGVTADWELVTVSGTLWTLGDLATGPLGLFDLRARALNTVDAFGITTLVEDQGSADNDAVPGFAGGLTFALPSNVNGYPAVRIISGSRHLSVPQASFPALLRGGVGGHIRYHANLSTLRIQLGASSQSTPATLTAQSSPHINAVIWDAAAGTVTLRENGNQVYQNTGQTLASSGAVFWVAKANSSGTNTSAGIFHPTGTTNVGILNRTDGIAPYDGDMSIWATFDYAPTTTEIEHIEGLWGHDFDLTLVAGHAYETTPPTLVTDSTGTLAATEGADTASLTGVVLVQGSVGATEGADTTSLSGTVLVQGTLGATEGGADTASISGTIPVAGSIAATESGDSASLSGTVLVQGSITASETGDSASLAGTVAVQGLLAASEGGDSASFDADVLVQGALAVSEAGVDSASLAGLVLVQGLLAATEGSDTFLASGSNTAVGFLASSEAADTASLSGSVLVQGLLAAAEGADSATLVGSAPAQGTLALNELPDAAAFVGQVIVQGILSATELADIVAITSLVPPPVPDRRTSYASRIAQTRASNIETTYASPRTGTSE